MGRAIYQVRLKIKSEDEREFNEWYEGTYIPKLMQEVPHFTAVQRYVGEIVRSWTARGCFIAQSRWRADLRDRLRNYNGGHGTRHR